MIRTNPAPMREGETLAQYRQLDHVERGRRVDGAFAARQVESFPLAWAGKLLTRWGRDHASKPDAANLAHMKNCASIAGAQRAGLRADANDGELCQEAAETARDMARRLAKRQADTPAEWPEGVRLLALWAEAQHWCEQRGLPDFGKLRGRIASILLRAKCDRWWRRVLRKMHARAVEATARAIGLVSRDVGCYASDDAVKRRRGQRARNAAALESVSAINEHGQEHTLAELAARGPANKAIRRHELMTRVAGFDLIARECGHQAFFGTITCASRMHKMKIAANGRAIENRAFDGTQVEEAQRHLCKQWSLFRPAAERAGLQLYGFRIAEPNHDGTPHWHFVLFVAPLGGDHAAGTLQGKRRGRAGADGQIECGGQGGGGEDAGHTREAVVLLRLLRRYFLFNDVPDEHGADRHRVKLEAIDPKKGSATGYIAKYIAKNIDGYKVGKDLFGNDAITSSERVETWASTWRIRQFQQIGGAPVGVWRELRRLHPEQAAASPAVELALDAVNITARVDATDAAHDIERRETAAHGWATYLHLQGGWRVKRKALRLGLLREQSGELGRYGELMPPKPVGVVTTGVQVERRPAFGIVPACDVRRTITSEVESERSQWLIVPRGSEAGALARIARPWSPVNNCTAPIIAPAGPLFRQSVERTKKRGKWHTWTRGRGTTEEKSDAPEPENHRH